MHTAVLYAAYGYLLVSGVLHYVLDVVLPYRRGRLPPGNDATQYYGLHAAYSLGQVILAGLALIVIWHGSDLMSRRPAQVLSFVAVAGWFTISVLYSDFVPPRINMGIVFVLLVAAAITA